MGAGFVFASEFAGVPLLSISDLQLFKDVIRTAQEQWHTASRLLIDCVWTAL